jgi:hypothetical protein
MEGQERHSPRGQADAWHHDATADFNHTAPVGGGTSRGRNGTYRRLGWGTLVGLVVLLAVALPAFWTAFAAYASFSGCFLECSEPEPAVGAVWAAITLFLLALPITVGIAVARIPPARGWPWYVGVSALLLTAAILAQRVI